MKEINDQQRDRTSLHPDSKTLSKSSKKTIAKKDADSLDAISTIPPAILREREILECRFQLLASKACSCLKELELLLKSTHQQMETWRSKYNDAELNVVKEVLEITKEAIEEGIPLWYHMHLSREELVIDQSDLVMDPQSMGQESLADLNTWHKEVLENFICIFQQKYPKGYILREDVTSIIRGEVQSVHTTCKNDFSICMVPRVPGTKQRPGGPFEIWVDYVEMLIKDSAKDTSIEKRRLIDWRSLLISLMDVHYDHFISMSTLKDVLEARTLLDEASKEIKGNITLEKFLGTKLWFDTDTLDRGLNSCEGVKKIIYSMLQCEDNGIPWQQIMLYLCLDEAPKIALQKVFCVFTSSLTEDSCLKPGDIIQALYPSGQDGALEAGFMLWSLDDLKDMIQKAREERSSSSPHTYEESWSEEAQASESDSMANQRGSTVTDKHGSIVQEASDLCDRALEAFVEAYNDAKKRGSLDGFELDEQAATIIQEFLDKFVYESNNRDLQKTKTSNPDADSATADMLSLQDLLHSSATTDLRAVLRARYGSKSLHLMI